MNHAVIIFGPHYPHTAEGIVR